VRHYKINSTDNSAYLNRAALVGCNNEKLSQDYANQLYTRKYLRDTSVTGRLGDMHINKDGRCKRFLWNHVQQIYLYPYVSMNRKQLYTRKYLRGVSVTGRLGDIQVNEDGSSVIC
jgi:hypothetical protein